MQNEIKVILAEDHNIARIGIKMLLDNQPDMTVVAEADNGLQLLDLINGSQYADIILADLKMPQLDGIGLINRLKSVDHTSKFIILTMFDNNNYIKQAFCAGARGYLLKNLRVDELFFAIKTVYAGNRYICTELALRMLDELLLNTEHIKEKAKIYFSTRELEVLSNIAEGYTSREVGEKLFISKRTVEGHRRALLVKTNTRNTAMLIRFACLNKYID